MKSVYTSLRLKTLLSATLGLLSASSYATVITSPVIAIDDTTGQGAIIHELPLDQTGSYQVTCMSGVTIDSVALTPFSDTPNATYVKTIEVLPNVAHINRLDRYRDTDGDGDKELDTKDGLRAQIDANGNVIGSTVPIDYICSADDGTPGLEITSGQLFMMRYKWPENITPNPGYLTGTMAVLPLSVIVSDTIGLEATKLGFHETACLVKVGPGYSTNAEGIDRFCLSETGTCTQAQCVSGDNICCPDNQADQPVFNKPECNDDPYAAGCVMMACCRLTPDAPGCFGCGVGERYCPTTGQCINPGAGETCGNTCNNNGICEVGESCDCGDCGGQQDTCQDGLTCNATTKVCEGCPVGGACNGCPEGTRWCSKNNQCIQAGELCGGGEVCNKNGICDADEGCGCGDCSSQRDHCAEGLICLYDAVTPANSSCQGAPWTLVSSEMRRELCTTEPSKALLQCADEDCNYFQFGDEVFSIDGSNFYGTQDALSFFEVLPNGPQVIGGALTFGSLRLTGTGDLVPLYIKAPNGMISQRYVYWNTQDTIAPTSSGLVFHTLTGDRVNLTAPRWSRSDLVATITCEDVSSGQDTPFCGCEIDEEYGFETFFVDRDDNRAKYVKTITSNGMVEFTVRDTAGNQSGNYRQEINFIDKDSPLISAQTQGGDDLSSIDTSREPIADISIAISDTLSGVEAYDVIIDNPTKFVEEIVFDTSCTGGTPLLASQRGREGTGVTVNESRVSTGQAIFVCARDAAGNVTKRKLTFGGSRLINYLQGPVKGFSYSGEIGVGSADDYESKLINNIQKQTVSINGAFGSSEGRRLSCQDSAIEQNIDIIARGRLNPHTGRQIIDDLTSDTFDNFLTGTNQRNSDGIIYYSFDTTGGSIGGNQGEVVELRGQLQNYTNWNDPQQGATSSEGDQPFGTIGVKGLKTVIIEGGNLYINSDMYYDDPQSMIVFVVKRGTPSINGHSQGGNVYIDHDVTNVNGLFFIDGAIMNVERTSSGRLEVLSSYEDSDVEKLRRQLLIYGSLASSNTRGGSLKIDPTNSSRITYELKDYDGEFGHCPFGTDGYNSAGSGFNNCRIQDAAKYDLETLRTFNLGYANKPALTGNARSSSCGGAACTCATTGQDYTPVGGIGTATVIPSYFSTTTYALSGKRECFYSDDPVSKLETTNELFGTYVKFDTREQKYKFKILDGATCR